MHKSTYRCLPSHTHTHTHTHTHICFTYIHTYSYKYACTHLKICIYAHTDTLAPIYIIAPKYIHLGTEELILSQEQCTQLYPFLQR